MHMPEWGPAIRGGSDVVDDNFGRVPAGWYADPLGLPQLRWWDNHAWTEHVSDARQPMMQTQPAAATIFADDDLTTRRSRRTADSSDSDEPPFAQPTAAVLRQLAPPLVEPSVVSAPVAPVSVAPEPVAPVPAQPAAFTPQPFASAPPAAAPTAAPTTAAPVAAAPVAAAPVAAAPATAAPVAPEQAARAADAFAAAAFADMQARSAADAAATAAAGAATNAPWVPLQRDAQGSGPIPDVAGYGYTPAPGYSPAPGYNPAPGYTSSPGYNSAPGFESAPDAPAFVPSWSQSPVSASDPGRRGTHQALGSPAPHLQSMGVWVIALLPMLQLLLSLLVLAAFSSGPSVVFMAVIWLAPYPITIVLAVFDSRSLRRRGVDRPASWLWALGTAPLYLIARAVRLSRISGVGYGPVAVFLLLSGLVGASVLAVPGLVIAALPAAFAAEASNSIELSSRSIGEPMEVQCPATPPLFIGQQLRCPASDMTGNQLVVTASLQRSNGWIAWQVDDWGVFSMIR